MRKARSAYCRECGGELVDSRWWPVCPVCYETLFQEQRRDHVRPPDVDGSLWTDTVRLEANFDAALGGDLP
jgi:hypothetical protein